MTSEADTRAPGRTVDVSPAALARIFPESGMTNPARPTSWVRRLTSRFRMRQRLIWTRLRFRFDDFRAIRLLCTGCRLRAKLMWVRLRYRGRLAKHAVRAAAETSTVTPSTRALIQSQTSPVDAARDLLENTK